MTSWTNIILFGIKLALILEKEFDFEPPSNKNVLKTKIKYYGDEAANFNDKEILKGLIINT